MRKNPPRKVSAAKPSKARTAKPVLKPVTGEELQKSKTEVTVTPVEAATVEAHALDSAKPLPPGTIVWKPSVAEILETVFTPEYSAWAQGFKTAEGAQPCYGMIVDKEDVSPLELCVEAFKSQRKKAAGG